jgi:hypothetical protein
LHPVPDTTYTLAFFRLKGIDSIATGITGTTTNFVPPRFVPCLVAGLAYYIAMKKPEVADRVAGLKQEYEFQFELAAGEDTETASIKFVPYNTFFTLRENMLLEYAIGQAFVIKWKTLYTSLPMVKEMV